MAKKVLIHGCYSNMNFGDLLLADILSKELHSLLGHPTVCPWTYENQPSLMHAKNGNGFKDWLSFDFAVFGGGGYLCSSPKRLLSKKLLKYYLPALICFIKRKPFIFLGVGAGPINSCWDKLLVRATCNFAKRIYVRDQESRSCLESIGVKSSNIQVTADLVLNLTPEMLPSTPLPSIEAFFKPLQSKKIFGLHLQSIASSQRLSDILSQIKKSITSNCEIVIFFDHSLNQEHLNSMIEKMKRISSPILPEIKFFDQYLDHMQLCHLIHQFDAVLTTKLHVGICAWTLNVAVCGYSSHIKTERFFKQIDRSHYQVRADQDVAIISKWTKMICENDPSFFRHDDTIRQNLTQQSSKNFVYLKEFVENAS
jgi:polysaccharide pyruvyl transferase WcaK-like protein